jgi:hypothetical protein
MLHICICKYSWVWEISQIINRDFLGGSGGVAQVVECLPIIQTFSRNEMQKALAL